MRRGLQLLLLLSTLTSALCLGGCPRGHKGVGRRYAAKPGAQAQLRVAVLPFSGTGPALDACQTVTTQVVNYLLATKTVSVVEPGLVKEAYSAVRLMKGDEDLTVPIVQQLAEQLQVDVLLVGRIDEWEFIAAGSERFPSVSIQARMIDARDARILWADTTSRTGRGGFLGSGGVDSLTILSQMVVRRLAKSVERSLPDILGVLAGEPATAAATGTGAAPVGRGPAAGVEPRPGVETAASPGPGDSAGPAAAEGAVAFQEPTKRFTNGELADLLVEVDGFARAEPTFGRHQHEFVLTTYKREGVAMEVELVDYWEPDKARAFLRQRNAETEVSDFQGFPSLRWSSGFGYLHLDVAVGRFGLYLRGPSRGNAMGDEIGTAVVNRLTG